MPKHFKERKGNEFFPEGVVGTIDIALKFFTVKHPILV
jgi:hypothetical protein